MLIVTWNSRDVIDDCLRSLEHTRFMEPRPVVLVVDNASTDGTAAHIRATWPWVHVVESGANLGFAGGNTFGWRWLRRRYAALDYLLLLNADTVADPGFLQPLTDWLDAYPGAAAAQPLLMLHPRTDRINTAGNRCHFLGFTLITRYGETPAADEQPREIDAVSGAACLLRADVLDRLGLFDERMFLYHEDTDLSWKLRQTGHTLALVPASRVYHKYRADAPRQAYGYLERNRLWVLLVYYRWRTLLLILPPLLAMEVGQWLYALLTGRVRQRLWMWAWLARRPNRRYLLALRQEVQQRRRVSDRVFLGGFTGRFESPHLPATICHVVTWLLAPYWAIARRLIRW